MKSDQHCQYIWQQPHWPRLHYDLKVIAPILASARRAQGVVIGQARTVGLEELAGVTRAIWIDEVVATAAIEGEKLNLDAVRSSVGRKLGLGDAGPISRSIDGLVDVMYDANHGFADPLTADRLCRWQSALFPGGTSGIRRIEVGRYRSFPDPMQIDSGRPGKEVIHYQAPPSSAVASEMDAFLAWFNTPDNFNENGIVRAALAHLWFETVHPFEDGNGRIDRAIVDMTLAQDLGAATRLYSMSRQILENRREYYASLNKAQTGSMDVTDWVAWFATQFEKACKKSTGVIDRALEKQRFWLRHTGVSISDRQRKVIQKLLDAGDGGFEGGLSAEKYCAITGVSKATATRDLATLLRAGLIIATGQGRVTRYYANVDGWHRDQRPDALRESGTWSFIFCDEAVVNVLRGLGIDPGPYDHQRGGVSAILTPEHLESLGQFPADFKVEATAAAPANFPATPPDFRIVDAAGVEPGQTSESLGGDSDPSP